MGRMRRHPPLYEVLASSSRRPTSVQPIGLRAAPAAPPEPQARPSAPEPELKPVAVAPAAASTRGRPTPGALAGSDFGTSSDDQGVPRIPVSTLVMAGLAIVGIALIAGGLVYQQGKRAGAQEEASKFGQFAPVDTGSPLPSPTDAGRTPAQPANVNRPDNAAKPPPAAPPGPAATDPRQPGTNYLALCVLPQQQAAAGVEFLRQNGLEAFYLVDRTRGVANNPTCRVYLAEGITSERWRTAEGKERSAFLSKRVEELGRKWYREHKGAHDFNQPLWALYKG